MHVFLTGERQIGKSRAVRAAAELLGRPCAGFRTRFLTRERGSSSLYMVPAAGPEILDEEHMVAMLENGKMRALTERFDALGTELLREARKKTGALILMDECGHLEKNALLFQRDILRCLNGPDPVLGVLRRGQPWHDFIINHPRVTVITVTEDNRAGLAESIAALIERP